jgi:conjugal transfer pilus assembly protein TraB
MVQFLKDFLLRVRSDRKTQVLSLLGVVALCYLMFSDGSPARRAPRPKPQVSVGANDPNERWKDLVERFNGQLNTLTTTTNALQEEVSSQKKAMQEYEATTAEIFKKILERLAEVQASPPGQTTTSQPPDLGNVAGGVLEPASVDELESIGGGESVAVQPPPQPAKPRLAAIMPGDSVRVKLLAGVNAPTDGTPYPVVLKLAGDVIGPDGNSVPLGEARLIAAAQGSLTDSRVLLRLTRLSIRLPNGRRKEFPVDGWIVGEDGIRGMEGVLIDPIGKAIAGAGMAGGLAGLGQGIALANTDTLTFSTGAQNRTIDSGAIPEYAGGVALSRAATEWQEIIRQRIDLMVPVVQVLSGREATAVFSQSLAIPDLLEQVDQDPSVVYASLD